MPSLEIRLFSAPTLHIDQLGRRKPLATLVCLAITGQTQTRETLLALLWPEHDPASTQKIKDWITKLKGELAAILPPAIVEAIRNRGKNLDLQETMPLLLETGRSAGFSLGEDEPTSGNTQRDGSDHGSLNRGLT